MPYDSRSAQVSASLMPRSERHHGSRKLLDSNCQIRLGSAPCIVRSAWGWKEHKRYEMQPFKFKVSCWAYHHIIWKGGGRRPCWRRRCTLTPRGSWRVRDVSWANTGPGSSVITRSRSSRETSVNIHHRNSFINATFPRRNLHNRTNEHHQKTCSARVIHKNKLKERKAKLCISHTRKHTEKTLFLKLKTCLNCIPRFKHSSERLGHIDKIR